MTIRTVRCPRCGRLCPHEFPPSGGHRLFCQTCECTIALCNAWDTRFPGVTLCILEVDHEGAHQGVIEWEDKEKEKKR